MLDHRQAFIFDLYLKELSLTLERIPFPIFRAKDEVPMKEMLQKALLACGLIILSSCGSNARLDAMAPPPKEWQSAPKAPPSMIVLPMQIRLADLSQEFQKRFPNVIAEQSNLQIPNCPTTDCRTSFRVLRKGNLQLRGNPDGSIQVVLPVRIEGQVAFTQSLGFTSIQKSQAFAGELTLNIANRLGVNPDWTLKSQTAATAQFSQAVLPIELPMVGTLNLNIQPILEPIVRKLMERQIPEIDKMIASRFSLRPYVEDIWKKVREPQSFTVGKNQVHFGLNPSEIYFQNLRAEGDFVSAAVGLKGDLRLSLGDPLSAVAASPLPPLRVQNQLNNQIQVYLPLRLPYAELNPLINEQIAGKILEVKDRKVQINQLEVFGNGDKLLVKIAFKSLSTPKADGIAYVEALPKYNPQTQMLELDQIKLTTETQSLLIKSAAWLATNLFESKIKEAAKFDLGSKLAEVKTQAETMFRDYKIPQANGLITLSGQLYDLKVNQILPESKGVHIVVMATGKLQARSTSLIQ